MSATCSQVFSRVQFSPRCAELHLAVGLECGTELTQPQPGGHPKGACIFPALNPYFTFSSKSGLMPDGTSQSPKRAGVVRAEVLCGPKLTGERIALLSLPDVQTAKWDPRRLLPCCRLSVKWPQEPSSGVVWCQHHHCRTISPGHRPKSLLWLLWRTEHGRKSQRVKAQSTTLT